MYSRALMLMVLPIAVGAQLAVIEIHGVMGERTTPYVSQVDELRLYKKPSLDAQMVAIPYREGWRVIVSARDGLTRVLEIGELRVTEPDDRMACSTPPSEGPDTLVSGESVEYLRYVGEGFGDIRFRGASCQAEVDSGLGHFRVIRSPEVQIWLPVYYADGTSPGWLLHDGTQVW